MALDLLYDRLVLQGTLDKTKRPYTFLKDTFFGNVVEHESEEFGFDIVKNGEQVAPYVHPEIGGKMLEKSGYTTKTFTPPLVAPEKIITAKDVERRLAGEEINGRDSWEVRQRKLAAQYLRELDESIARREEIQCAELLTTGQITVVGEGYPASVIQFWPTTPADKPYIDIGATDATKYWGGANANPIDDFVLAADRIEDHSTTSATVAILGGGAAAALRANEDVWKKMDNRRINVGELETKRLGGGVRYLGTFLDSGLEVYTYRGNYIDPVTKLRKKFIPDNLAVVTSREMIGTMNYGLVTLTDEEREIFVRVAKSRVPDSWMQRKRPAGRILQVQSRPLATIKDIDSVFVMKVLAGA